MMKIEKNTVLRIDHTRKGVITVIALQDFDTSEDVFWPVAVAQKKPVRGISNFTEWGPGDQIPCRGQFVKSFTVIEPDEAN